jgi:hypothetical protein
MLLACSNAISQNSPQGIELPVPFTLDRAEEIQFALGAAPEHLRAGAGVYIFGKDGYEKIRTSENGINCMVNCDSLPIDSTVLRPTCWDPEGSATLLPIALWFGELLAHGKKPAEISRDIERGFDDGRFISPRKTGIAYMLSGDLRYDKKSKSATTLFPPHYMIYATDVSNANIGLTKEVQKQNPLLPFIYTGYSGGSRTAYLIILATHTTLTAQPNLQH